MIGIAGRGYDVGPLTLFVLTLLVVVPGASAQPLEPEMLFSWFEWTIGLLLVLRIVVLRQGWFFLKIGDMLVGSDPQQTALQQNEPPELDYLDAKEKYTGLTLVQRARLRRQLLKGEIVEAPILRMRFGGLRTWLQGPETELQGSRVQKLQ